MLEGYQWHMQEYHQRSGLHQLLGATVVIKPLDKRLQIHTPEKGPKHRAARRGCSSRRYQVDIMTITDGNIADSKAPRRNLTAAALAKLVHAAIAHPEAPHKINEVPTYLPIGSRVRSHDVGNSAKRYAILKIEPSHEYC